MRDNDIQKLETLMNFRFGFDIDRCASKDTIREWADEKKFEVYVNYDEEYAIGITKMYGYIEGVSNLENPVSSESGMTALEGAASSGNIQLVKYLLNKEEVDIKHRDSMGMTALFMTPEWKEEEDSCIVIAEMLFSERRAESIHSR